MSDVCASCFGPLQFSHYAKMSICPFCTPMRGRTDLGGENYLEKPHPGELFPRDYWRGNPSNLCDPIVVEKAA